MDWDTAIEKNREALKRVLAMLVAMAGLAGVRPTLPRHLHHAVLRLLRPAEAAARRLVIVAARGMVVPPVRQPMSAQAAPSTPSPSALRADTSPPEGGEEGSQARRLSFPLFDPLRRFRPRQPVRRGVPRISFPGLSEPFPISPSPSPSPYDAVNATRLGLRFAALGRVLDDLPREARRFARWRCRNAARAEEGRHFPLGRRRIRRVWPLRPGRPPGHRPAKRGARHEVHDILDVTHGLAFWALEDTS
jgi:hypothetical protein